MRPLTRVRFGLTVLWRSIQVVAANRRLVALPVLSWGAFVGGIAAVYATATGVTVLPDLVASIPEVDPGETTVLVLGIADPVLAFLLGAVLTTYFNAAMVHLVIDTLRDEPVRLRDGVASAFGVIEHLVAWSVITSSVGVVYALLERVDPTGNVSGFRGLPRASTAFLVLPVIVYENVSRRKATERSRKIFRRRWGEASGASLGIDLVLSTVAVLAIGVVAVVQFDPTVAPADPVTVAGVVVLGVVLLLRQLAVPVAKAGVYVYATTGEPPEGFEGIDFADVTWDTETEESDSRVGARS